MELFGHHVLVKTSRKQQENPNMEMGSGLLFSCIIKLLFPGTNTNVCIQHHDVCVVVCCICCVVVFILKNKNMTIKDVLDSMVPWNPHVPCNIIRTLPNGEKRCIMLTGEEHTYAARVIRHLPLCVRSQFIIEGLDLFPQPPTPSPLSVALAVDRDSKLYGQQIWSSAKKQSSINFLSVFENRPKSNPVSITTFTGKTYRAMTYHDRLKYLKMKARDVERNIPYYDNEVATGTSCRLVLELDWRTKQYRPDWSRSFTKHARRIARLAKKVFQSEHVFAHCLSRPSALCEKHRVFKYGLHIIFPDIVVDMSVGKWFSDLCKQLFPDREPGYVDGVYGEQMARLRPIYSRKIVRDKLHPELSHASSYYDYACSVDESHVYQHKFESVYEKLVATAMNPPTSQKSTPLNAA